MLYEIVEVINIDKVLFSSNKTDWETPDKIFDELNQEFHFELDAAASESNAKCEKFYTEKEDGLNQKWDVSTFCNPPYGRKLTGEWVKKAYQEHQKYRNTIVLLIPARTDTKWFHEYIYNKAEIRFLKGRLKFKMNGVESKESAPFPSMIVIFNEE